MSLSSPLWRARCTDSESPTASVGGRFRRASPSPARRVWLVIPYSPPLRIDIFVPSMQGGIAADEENIFVGSEDMTAYALRQSDGSIRATNRVRGQSFRLTHPVV